MSLFFFQLSILGFHTYIIRKAWIFLGGPWSLTRQSGKAHFDLFSRLTELNGTLRFLGGFETVFLPFRRVSHATQRTEGVLALVDSIRCSRLKSIRTWFWFTSGASTLSFHKRWGGSSPWLEMLGSACSDVQLIQGFFCKLWSCHYLFKFPS